MLFRSEAVFGPVVQRIQEELGIKPDQRILEEYSKVAGAMNMKTAADVRDLRQRTADRLGITYEELIATVGPMEDIYIICDHSRALAFMLNDGVVPSNVREGYFARMLVRRALRSMRSLNAKFTLSEIVGRQIDYFSPHFPELIEGILRTFSEKMNIGSQTEELRMFVQSFNFLIISFLGAGACIAQVQGMDPEEGRYRDWIRSTLGFIFLPRLRDIILKAAGKNLS